MIQKTFIVLGLVLVAIGLLWPWLSRLPFGRLPGDIAIHRDGMHIWFPVTSMILLSLVLSLVLWLLKK